MSAAAKSVFIFGIYLGFLGIILAGIPNVLLTAFGFPSTNEVWIRVVGMLVLLLSIYYVRMAKKEQRDFFWISVYARSSVIIFFTLFVLAGFVQPVLIFFGVADLLGALWTWWALRQ